MKIKQISCITNISEYFIDTYGNIYQDIGKGLKLLSQTLNVNGYYHIGLSNKDGKRKTYRVHRLVALEFIENPNLEVNDIVNHIDGKKDQ